MTIEPILSNYKEYIIIFRKMQVYKVAFPEYLC